MTSIFETSHYFHSFQEKINSSIKHKTLKKSNYTSQQTKPKGFK